jgi:hypothetical protein
MVRLSDVEPEDVSWLWFPYIPRGKLTMLDGEEGIGKSWLLCALAARISQGERLPFADEDVAGNVLLLSGSEDGLSDTVRPRLDGVGADCTRIYAIDEPFTLNDAGLLRLAERIAEIAPVLVVIDPLFDYVGARTDINRDNETRAQTKPLRELAERFSCALVAVRHIGKAKGNGEARAAGLGGIGWRAAGRSNLLVGADPQDRSKRAMVLTKSNLADVRAAKAIGFTLDAGQFYWLGASELTAERILSRFEDAEERAEKSEAVSFLRSALSDGAKAANDIKAAATQAGFSERNLRTARTKLGVVIRKEGFTGKWVWSLPDTEDVEDVGKNNNDIFGIFDTKATSSGDTPAARCPFCRTDTARRETWRYARVADEHGNTHSAPCVLREITCAACDEVLDMTFHFDEDLLAEVEERAGIMEYDGGLSRHEAERRAAVITTSYLIALNPTGDAQPHGPASARGNQFQQQ